MGELTNYIETLRDIIAECLYIPPVDLDMIDFIFATYASNRMPGDPLWGAVVDASGGGKTELLRSLRPQPDTYFLSKLTSKTLKSGYRDPKHPGKDPSLLLELDGKVVVIKDLSPLLSMRRDDRNSIISDLRDAYDGFSDDGYGNVGKVSYTSKFTLLAASTMAIERYDRVEQELGERLVKFRARGTDNLAKVKRAVTNIGMDDDWREVINESVSDFLAALPDDFPKRIPQPLSDAVVTVANFTATARSHVPRDRSHELSYIPRAEVGTRLVKELAKLLLSLAFIRGKSEPDLDDLATVCRVAKDCLPPNRLEVLEAAVNERECALPESTARNTVADLVVLGVLKPATEFTNAWEKSLRELRNLLKADRLHARVTTGVSVFF
jgi:hypothetical protein